MKPTFLSDWHLEFDEEERLRLRGFAIGHPRFGTKEIRSSRIVARLGPWLVQTATGTIYQLDRNGAQSRASLLWTGRDTYNDR